MWTLFSLVSIRASCKQSLFLALLCFHEGRFELQELDFGILYDSTGDSLGMWFQMKQKMRFGFGICFLCMVVFSSCYSYTVSCVAVLVIIWNHFQLQLLFLVFVLKQHLQAVAMISVSKAKGSCS